MSTLGRTRLRLAGDAACFDTPLDVIRRATPQFWRGNDLQFEVAVLFNGVLQDVSNLASMTLEIRPLGAGGCAPDPGVTPLMGATVTAFDNTTTLDDWNSGVKQHAVIAFAADESNIAAGAAWLSLFVVTQDSPGHVITLCAGPVRVLEDGSGLAATPEPATETFYTAAQSDARFAPIGSGGGGSGAPLSDNNPLMNGAAAPGTSTSAARADHVHPTDTSRAAATHASQHGSAGGDPVTLAQSQITGLSSALAALAPLASPTFTGTPAAPTVSSASDSSTKLATTAFVQAAIAAAGSGGGGAWGSITGTLASQTDLAAALAALAPLASPAFTGSPTAPTVSSATDSSTKLATTAFVQAALAAYTAPITNDGSGHYVFGSGSPLDIGTSTPAGLSVYGGLAVSTTLQDLFINTYGGSGTFPLPNQNVAALWHKNDGGCSSIIFVANPSSWNGSSGDYATTPGGGYPGWQVGAIGWINCPPAPGGGHDGAWYANNAVALSASQPYPFPDGTVTLGALPPPKLMLGQEGLYDGANRYVARLLFDNDWSANFIDPYGNTMVKIPARLASSGVTRVRVMGNYNTSSTSDQFEIFNIDDNLAVFAAYPSNFSYHAYPASGAAIIAGSQSGSGSGGSGGLALMATHSAGIIKFITGGDATSNEALRIDAAKNLIFSNRVTSAPSVTLASGQYQITVYDNGSAPVLRVRYNNGSAVKVGDLALS